jgi:hypothetical protein
MQDAVVLDNRHKTKACDRPPTNDFEVTILVGRKRDTSGGDRRHSLLASVTRSVVLLTSSCDVTATTKRNDNDMRFYGNASGNGAAACTQSQHDVQSVKQAHSSYFCLQMCHDPVVSKNKRAGCGMPRTGF